MASNGARNQVKLSFPLVPKEGKVETSDRDKAFAVEPMNVLPLSLLPSARNEKRPPLLHFGWLVEEDVVLRMVEEYRKSRPVVNIRECLKHEIEEWGLTDEDLEEDEEPVFQKPTMFQMQYAFGQRRKAMQLDRPAGLFQVFDSAKRGTSYIIAITTNYDIRRRPMSKDDRIRLAKEFNFSEKPKWFLDVKDWYWK